MIEYIVENAGRIPFRDMSEADQVAILKAKLNAPESVEFFCISWAAGEAESILLDAIYRVRAIATPLVIPWEVIRPKYSCAAILEDLKTLLLSPDDLVFEQENWRSVSMSFDVCYITALNIDTTGIDWRRSEDAEAGMNNIDRNAVIEECAKVCHDKYVAIKHLAEQSADQYDKNLYQAEFTTAKSLSIEILALKSQPAQPDPETLEIRMSIGGLQIKQYITTMELNSAYNPHGIVERCAAAMFEKLLD